MAPMNARLVFVVGPSGAGKDTLLDYARARLPPDAGVVFVQRTITRPAAEGGEGHRAVTQAEFDQLLAAGAFAMHWQAHGRSYGIPREILDWLAAGRTVVVNGSREHLPAALAAFPDMEIVHITAAPDVLRARLIARERDDAAGIEARLARAAALAIPAGVALTEIRNEGALEDAGRALLAFLSRR